MPPNPLTTAARKYLGHPYTWCGKKDLIFNQLDLKLETSPWLPELVFDCSGLVTVALLEAGGPDWRGTHSASVLRSASFAGPLARWVLPHEGDLLFAPGHVAIYRGPGRDSDHVWVIEAAGGHATTTSPAIAAQIGARVQEHETPLHRFFMAGRLPIAL